MAKSRGTGTGMRPSLRGFLAAALGKSRYAAAMEDSCNNGSSSIGVWKGFSCTASPRTKSFRNEGGPQMEKSCCQEDAVYRSFNSLYILSDLNTRTTAIEPSLHPLPEEEEEEEEHEDEEDPSFGCFAASSSGSSVVIDKVTIYEHDCVSSVCKTNSCSNSGKFLWKDKLCVVDVGGHEEEEELSNSTNSMDPDLDLFTSSAGGSLYSSEVSSSESDRGCEFLAGLFRGLSSQRFFFCPDNSNSIMEQAKCKCLTKSAEEATSSCCRITEIDEQKQDQEQIQVEVQDQDLERQKLDISYFVGECSNSNSAETGEEEEDAEMGDDATEKSGAAGGGGGTGHRIIMEGSKALRLYSSNPHEDFRISMQEMVAAHGISDWCALQHLLLCYLNLNSRKTHEFILGAFTDLLKELIPNTSSSDRFPLIDYAPPKG